MKSNATDSDPLEEAYNRALSLEKAGKLDSAAAAYHQVLELDPHDCGGAQIRLAAIGHGEAPLKAPNSYVATLFDQTALAFESILVDSLHYDIPVKVSQQLKKISPRTFKRVLDLGCGTGLSGMYIQNQCQHITGVDLSEKMINVAYEKECYDELYVAEIVNFLLNSEHDSWDLIIATDVLPYFGCLEVLFNCVSKNTCEGGLFAFSSESLIDSHCKRSTYKVNKSCRFVHSETYILNMLSRNNFSCIEIQPTIIRKEEGNSVQGNLVFAQKLNQP